MIAALDYDLRPSLLNEIARFLYLILFQVGKKEEVGNGRLGTVYIDNHLVLIETFQNP